MKSAAAHLVPEEKLALSLAEAAQATSLSRSTLYLLLGTGQLPTIKVGGRRLVLRSDLQAYLHSQRVEA